MKYTVYVRTNLVNGMQYVGQSGDFETREKQFNRIKQRYANKLLTKDRQEFGLENFSLKILAEVDTQEEAWELEKKFIKELDTKFPNGYNMGDGGKDSSGTKHTDESRENMSQASKKFWDELSDEDKENFSRNIREIMSSQERREAKSKQMKQFFKEHPEFIEKIRELGKTRIGGKNPFFGKHHSEEFKRKQSEKSKGKHHSPSTEFPSKKVYKYDSNYNLLEIYPSTAECARQNNVCQSAISYAAKSKSHMCKGNIYSFEYMQPLVS